MVYFHSFPENTHIHPYTNKHMLAYHLFYPESLNYLNYTYQIIFYMAVDFFLLATHKGSICSQMEPFNTLTGS